MLKSFLRFHPKCEILICENSEDDQTRKILKSAKIPFIEPNTIYHSPSVDYLLKKVKTKYCLLVDTDVIFLKSNNDLFKKFIDSRAIVMGKIFQHPRKRPRIDPCYMLVDVERINKEGVKFHDANRTDASGADSNGIEYNVGSSFLEDIRKKDLKILDYDGEGMYYKHYGGMSWKAIRYVKDHKLADFRKAEHAKLHLLHQGQVTNRLYMEETAELEKTELRYQQ
jgi:hypothetical protein